MMSLHPLVAGEAQVMNWEQLPVVPFREKALGGGEMLTAVLLCQARQLLGPGRVHLDQPRLHQLRQIYRKELSHGASMMGVRPV